MEEYEHAALADPFAAAVSCFTQLVADLSGPDTLTAPHHEDSLVAALTHDQRFALPFALAVVLAVALQKCGDEFQLLGQVGFAKREPAVARRRDREDGGRLVMTREAGPMLDVPFGPLPQERQRFADGCGYVIDRRLCDRLRCTPRQLCGGAADL